VKAHHHTTTRKLAGIGALAVALLSAGAVHAQVLTGRVLSSDSLTVIPAAFIQVFDQQGARVGTGLTTAEGLYQIQLATAGGPFRLQVDAFAFERSSVEVPRLLESQSLALDDILLIPAPIILEEIRVEADRPRLTPGREWVRKNQLYGKGTFLAGAMIALDAPRSLGRYIADRTELWVTYNARGEPLLYNPAGAMSRCVNVMVNRWELERTGYRSIDDIPADAIAAIEIYDNDRERPPGYYFEGRPGCGLIQVWLWNSW
jgi:hypothetical protein